MTKPHSYYLNTAARLTFDDDDVSTIGVDTPSDFPLAMLGALSRSLAKIEESRAHYVTCARQAGHSWELIGDALGMTRQAAHQRYGN